MRKLTGVMIAALIIWVQPIFAQQEQQKAFTLKEAVDFAKRNNYSLLNSKLDLESSQKKVNEILASGLPQINGSANLTNNLIIGSQIINFGGQSTVIKFGTNYNSSFGVSASQLIFDGTFFMGLKASKEFVNLSKLNVNRSEIETEVSVSKAYYLCLLLSVNEELMGKNIENLQKSKNDLEQIYKNGFAEKIDFDRLTLQLSNLQLQRDKIHDQKLLAQMILKLQMGMPVNSPIDLTDKLEDLFQKSTAEVVPDKVDYNSRIEYKMLKKQLVLNNYDKKRYNVGYLPTLAAFYNNQRNTFGNNFSNLYRSPYSDSSGRFPNSYTDSVSKYPNIYKGSAIGLSLTVPIFDGFRKNAQIQQTKINIRKTENDMKNFENVIEQQVFQSKTNYLRTKQQIEIQKKNMELAQQIYAKAELKYKNGVGSSLELTTAQTDLENSRSNYLSTIYDFFVADLDLKKAVGAIK